jgi:hypothetical protein
MSNTVQYPTSNTYQSRVAAWVSFTPQNFSTRSDTKKAVKNGGGSGYMLPLQRYSSPNSAGYAEVEPSGIEQIGMGIRDLVTGGGVGRLSNTIDTIISVVNPLGFGVGDVSNALSGIKGAAQQEVSNSDLLFQQTAKRPHSFGFSLYAKNKADAQAIDTIVNGFQTRLYPFMETRTLNRVSPPPMWGIKIIPNGGASNSLVLENSIQPSVLVNCSITRLDANAPVLTRDNYYMGIDLTLSFTEIEPAYRSYDNPEKLFMRSEFVW